MLPRPEPTGTPRPKHPAGTHQIALADLVLLGKKIATDRKSGNRYPQERIALIFQSMECLPDSAERFTLSEEFTWTFAEKGNLWKFLAPWLGPWPTAAAAEAALTGLDSQIGRNALATIAHNAARDGSGKVFVNIQTVGPLMKDMKPFAVAGYTRSPYWAKRTEQYAADYAAFLAQQRTTPSKAAELAYDDVPPALVEPEPDLPF